MPKHELYIRRALDLAAQGKGEVSPNPMVGCVIVYNDKVIGEGYHQKYGEAHAEVNAINAVEDKNILPQSTVYVTLEPCSHFGNTPPCTDLLIKSNVRNIVICNTDSNPLVSGNGIKKLEENGINIISGILKNEGEELNKHFFYSMRNKSPFIILKWAETADGFIARKNYSSKWITNWFSRKIVHKWRAENDAIMVGTNTAHYDNPSLNVRDWKGNNPLRIVVDKNLRLDKNLNLFDKKQSTVCYNFLKNEVVDKNLLYKKLSPENIEEQILIDLFERKIQSVIIEGGKTLLQSFINKGLWQEARIFKSKNTFEKGISAPKLQGNLISIEKLLENELLIYTNTLNTLYKKIGKVT